MKCGDLSTLSILGTIALRGTKEYVASLQKPFPSQGLTCRCPLAVIFPSGVRDVVATIAFCKDNAISMSILNGGQDPSLSCVAGDLVLDMSGMSGVHVDLEANVARVGAGTIFRQLDYELELHGVCVPGPIFSSIGVSGAFLGGGWGYFTKQYGMICDQVEEIELVTVSGEILSISSSTVEHRDLFWALIRGGGAGTLCVVTAVTMQLHSLPKNPIYSGLIEFPVTCAQRLVDSLKKHKSSWPVEFLMYPIIESNLISCLVFCSGGFAMAAPFLNCIFREALSDQIVNHASDKTYFETQIGLDSYCMSSDGTFCFQKAQFISDLSFKIVEMAISRLQDLKDDGKDVRIFFQNYFEDTGYLVVVRSRWAERGNDLTEFSTKLIEDITKEDGYEMGGAPHYSTKNTSLSELFSTKDKVRLMAVKEKYDPENFFVHHVMKL